MKMQGFPGKNSIKVRINIFFYCSTQKQKTAPDQHGFLFHIF